MGLPSLTRGAADSRYAAAGHFVTLTSRMELGAEDACWLNLGDSCSVLQGAVGSGADMRWFFQTAQALAASKPAWSVVFHQWNDGSQTWEAAITVQTGTGPRTLHMYNAAVTGIGVAYFTQARLAIMAAVNPNLVSIALGHNDSQDGPTYRPSHFGLMRALEDWFPYAGLATIPQNPRTSPDTGAVNGLSRCQAIIDLAGAEDWGCPNVTQAFLNTPNWQTALLLPDGLHPNPAGSALWTRVVMQHLSQSLLAIPRAPTRRAHRMSVPIGEFIASAEEPGSVLDGVGLPNLKVRAWSFHQDTPQTILATFDPPDWWKSINIYVVMGYAVGTGYTGANSVVKWAVGTSRHGSAGGTQPFASPANSVQTVLGVPSALAYSTALLGASNTGPWGLTMTRVTTGLSVVGRPLNIGVRRVADDAADTLQEAAYLRRVIIERAS